MAVLAVGSVALDTVETPAGRADEILGGSAVYFACAASLFTEVRLVGVVGEDFPPEHLDFLRGRGVNTEGVVVQPGRTFRWHGRYHDDMNVRDTVDVQLNVFGAFDPVIPASFRRTGYVFLANARPALQMKVLDQVADGAFAMADTMNLWVEHHRDELERLLRRVDGVLMNDEEARLLTGQRNLLLAGERIAAAGLQALVIKKGEHGALLFAGNACTALPAFPVRDVADPTGAGDSFAGALMGCLAEADRCDPETLHRAVACGVVMASFTVEAFGLERLKTVTREAFDRRLEAYRRMLRV